MKKPREIVRNQEKKAMKLPIFIARFPYLIAKNMKSFSFESDEEIMTTVDSRNCHMRCAGKYCTRSVWRFLHTAIQGHNKLDNLDFTFVSQAV